MKKKHRQHTKKGRDLRRKESPQLRGWRLWLFRFLMGIGIPLLLIVSIEMGLRVFGYGVPMGLTLRQDVGGQQRILSNTYYTWKYFDPLMARPMIPFALPAEKKPATSFRIVLLGGSAARGIPGPEFGIARMLQVMLEAQYPGVRFDVINTATVAINSHVVYDIARESAKTLQPDLFLVYMGNNEVVGPYGAGTVFASYAPNVHFARVSTKIRSLRLGQLIRRTKRNRTSRGGGSRTWAGPEMFVDQKIRTGDPRLASVYENFTDNIDAICRIARRAGIPVILSTVSVNLRDSPPFSSLHRAGMPVASLDEWDLEFGEAVKRQGIGNHQEALGYLLKAEDMDDRFAELHYRKGRSLEALGKVAEAKRAYIRARDLDALRLRADSTINRIIRDTADRVSDDGITVVDAEEALSAESLNGITGKEMFLEYVHMTVGGNYEVARVFYEAVGKRLPEWVTRNATHEKVLPLDACKRFLVFNDFEERVMAESMYGFVGKPPFTGQLNNQEQRQYFRSQALAISTLEDKGHIDALSRQYERRLAATLKERGRTDWWLLLNYGRFLMFYDRGDPKAETQFRDVLRQVPQSKQALVLLIENLLLQNKAREAAVVYQNSLAYLDKSPEYENAIGTSYYRVKNYPGAIGHFQKAMDLEPRWSEIHYSFAVSLMSENRASQKMQETVLHHLEKALEINPQNKPARALLREIWKRKNPHLPFPWD